MDLITSELVSEYLQFFDIDSGMCKFIFLQQVRRVLGPTLKLGWATGKPGRCRDLVWHPNQTRPAATEETDADGEGAPAFFHQNPPPWLWGVDPWRELFDLSLI